MARKTTSKRKSNIKKSQTKRKARAVKKMVKSVSSPVKKLLEKSLNKSSIRKVVRIDALDRVLLSMAAKPYDKILQKIKLGKKRLNDERGLALQIGNRILDKAKKVRDSLINTNKNS
ncbi:MAG: hypothetical protein A2Z20_04730 [Bdellovibrionales bacterium RBG_16_40_8]|nr:MAG: hypothetical protein A2Z20_04730 [Bdellovibrionales bacterium RBG_16_40_8]